MLVASAIDMYKNLSAEQKEDMLEKIENMQESWQFVQIQ